MNKLANSASLIQHVWSACLGLYMFTMPIENEKFSIVYKVIS